MFINIYSIVSTIIIYLYLRNPGQKAAVSLKLSQSVLALKDPGEEDIPEQHRLDVSTVTRQTLGVFSHVTRKFINF